MKAVIYGAGSIGRGFIGELMYLSGYDIVLVDIDNKLLKLITQNGGYKLHLISKDAEKYINIPVKKVIDGRNIDAAALEIKDCDLVFTAVGINALKHIASSLAEGLSIRDRELNIILCENAHDADDMLKKYVQEKVSDDIIEKTGFIKASVGRMVPLKEAGADPLTVKAEPYYHLPIDGENIIGVIPQFTGLEIVKPFDYAIERKLYIHNLGHCVCAWLGYLKRYEYIWQAAEDEEIKEKAVNAMTEAAYGLNKKYNANLKELKQHIDDLIIRFGNIALGDTIERVGRDTLRKLSTRDRVVGALKMCADQNVIYDTIVEVIVAGLCFKADDDGTKKMQRLLNDNGVIYVLKNHCKLNDDEAESVMKYYNDMI